jgi:hypothetical protein
MSTTCDHAAAPPLAKSKTTVVTKFVRTAVPINPTATLRENLNENMVAFLRSRCT